MSNAIIGWPIYSDYSGPTYTTTLARNSSWPTAGQMALSNLKDRRLHRIARSTTAQPSDTRFLCDLAVDRAVRLVALPKGTWSTTAKWRIIGKPASQLFTYEAGDDIAALSGTFTRAPTATVRAASYITSGGVVTMAGENRAVQSEDFGTTWSASNVTVASDSSVASPDTATTYRGSLTATNANGTVLQSITETAVSWTFSVWLKRKTGTGAVSITANAASAYTAVSVTSDWKRFSVTQTGAAGAGNVGIKLATSGDAVYAWGAQAEIGTTATSYLPTAASTVSAPRDAHYTSISGARSLLLEGARTNLCLQSENLGTTWAAVGTPTRSAAAHTASGVTLDLIGDDAAGTLEGYTQTVTFTGNAVKAVSLFIKGDTSSSTVIRLRDTSAGADRLLATITWNVTPVITMTTGTSFGYQTLAGGVYRINLATTSVTAANTNSLQIYPATDSALAVTGTGTVYVGGVQAEDALFPSSYIPTTTGTVARALDSLTFPYSAVPQEATAYTDAVHYLAADVSTNYTSFIVGSTTFTAPYWRSMVAGLGTAHYTDHNNGSAAVNSSTGAAAFGNRLEQRSALASTGAITAGVSIDSAAETTGSASAANTLAAAWQAAFIVVGAMSAAGSEPAFMALRSLRITPGTKTLAEMRTVVSDSGWLDMWPSGIDAEESEGMNVPAVYILSTAFTARYWSVQIADTAATGGLGYLDVARLIIAGAFQPTVNFAWGAEISVDTLTVRERTRSGVAYYDEQPRFRRVTVQFDNSLTDTEALVNVLDFQRIAGIHKQFYFVWDPADTTHMHRRSFLATLEKTSALRAIGVGMWGSAFDIVEEI